MLSEFYNQGYQAALDKIAGGPGSGVTGNNTAPITGYPRSKHVSVSTRKALLDNMAYEKRMIPVSEVSHVAQAKYVPSKLEKFIDDPTLVTKDPIDVLVVPGEETTVVDGHHRFLSAKKLGIKELPARVYTKRRKTGRPMRLDTALKA